MSIGGSFVRRNAGLAVPTPIYADNNNDSPIDLRKKVAIRRQRRFEYGYSDDEDEDDDVSPAVVPRHAHPDTGTDFWFSNGRKNPFQQAATTNPYFLSLRNLHPGLSEQYGIQYALFNSPEGTHVVPVPYSPFHHRSIISEYKHRHNGDQRDYPHPNRHRDEPDPRQRFDNVHEETKRILKHNLLNRERKDDPPTRVTPIPKSGSPSPTEHFKKRHLKQSYWSKTEEAPTYHNGQNTVQKTPVARESVQQNQNSNNSSQSSWLRIKKIVASRLRSHSCSDVKDGRSTKPQNKSYRIHTGYGSDTDIVLRPKNKPTTIKPESNRRRSPEVNKVYSRPAESEDNSSDSFIKVQNKHTLLKLLSGSNNYQPRKEVIEERKKGIGVLLQHLQQNPVNHNTRRDDGYPWGVYEYYNHLVERSSRLNPSNYIQRTYADHGSLVDEDSANQQRKRPSRALTGKHVKHGTGASPSTLITLRQKIQERQKAKELLILHGQSDNFAKVSSPRNGLSKKLKLGNFKRVKQDTLPTMYQSSKLCP